MQYLEFMTEQELQDRFTEAWEDSEKRLEILNKLQSKLIICPLRSKKTSIIKEITDAN